MIKVCRECKRELDLDQNFYTNKDCKDGHTPTCKICYKSSRKDYYYLRGGRETIKVSSKILRDKLKEEVLQHYGGVCACCGIIESAFLSIDHVNGGGTKQRKALGFGGSAFYTWLRKMGFPEGFQVLCHNCNMGRHVNGGVCPHKR